MKTNINIVIIQLIDWRERERATTSTDKIYTMAMHLFSHKKENVATKLFQRKSHVINAKIVRSAVRKLRMCRRA